MSEVRAPVEYRQKRSPRSDEFDKAVRIVELSGLVPELSRYLDAPTGRKRRLSVKGLLVGLAVNALESKHDGHVVEVARNISAMTNHQRDQLGINDWDPDQANDRVDYLFLKLAAVLTAAPLDSAGEALDADAFADRLLAATFVDAPPVSRSLAVDATDLPTWGAFVGDLSTLPVDEPGAENIGVASTSDPRVVSIGADGRARYTKDPDATGGRRSANGDRSAGEFNGYHVYAGSHTRDVGDYRDPTDIALGPPVPALIRHIRVRPANTNPAKAIVPAVLAGLPVTKVKNVLADRGITQMKPTDWLMPLMEAGVSVTFDLKSTQRGPRPFKPGVALIDGSLFADVLPPDLTGVLPMPPMNTPEAEKVRYQEAFNRRALYLYGRHQAPDSDGYTRWRSPFDLDRLRTPRIPKTMRLPWSKPEVDIPAGVPLPPATVTASAKDLRLWQPVPFGTTAWQKSYSRRNAVESTNGQLKKNFVHMDRGFTRVFGLVKTGIFVTFAAVGHNVDRIKSFLAAARAAAARKSGTARRAKRRGHRLELLMAEAQAGPNTAPALSPD